MLPSMVDGETLFADSRLRAAATTERGGGGCCSIFSTSAPSISKGLGDLHISASTGKARFFLHDLLMRLKGGLHSSAGMSYACIRVTVGLLYTVVIVHMI